MVFWLVLITFIAFFLRIDGLTQSPPSPYWEEVALGYDAYSILKTGKDHHGNAWPIVAFPSFGDFKPSLYFYAVVPSVQMFGLNTFAVRFPAVVASSLSVGLTSWLAWRWSRSRAVAGWSGILLAIQPWSWLIGRVGFEVNLAVTLILSAVVCFELSKVAHMWKKVLGLTTGAALLALSMYAYHAARLWGPLVGISAFFLMTEWSLLKTQPQKMLVRLVKTWLFPALLAILLLVPLIQELRNPAVLQRVNETSIFSNPEPVLASNEARESLGNVWWSRVLFHRWWWRGAELAESYTSHFSPDFLFGRGDENNRHSSRFFGMLAPWETVTVVSGIVALIWFWTGSVQSRRLLITLILISPAAAMVTTATPHALRSLLFGPWLAMLSAIGVVFLLKNIFRVIPRQILRVLILAGLCGAILISTLAFWLHLRFVYPVLTESDWQYGYQEVIETTKSLQRPGEIIYFTREYGRPAMYLFFFDQTEPLEVQAKGKTARRDQLELLEYSDWRFEESNENMTGLHVVPADKDFAAEYPVLSTISGPSGKQYWKIIRVE